MKVLKNKLTSRLGETQFSDDAEVLVLNAKAAGFADNEIEIIDMAPYEYSRAIKTQNENDLSSEKKQERKIMAEENKILREQAIANLKARGEL